MEGERGQSINVHVSPPLWLYFTTYSHSSCQALFFYNHSLQHCSELLPALLGPSSLRLITASCWWYPWFSSPSFVLFFSCALTFFNHPIKIMLFVSHRNQFPPDSRWKVPRTSFTFSQNSRVGTRSQFYLWRICYWCNKKNDSKWKQV